MIDYANFTSKIEDIIVQNMNNVPQMYNLLRSVVEPYSEEDIGDALGDMGLFGDEKLSRIIIDVKKGKPLDSAYIQSLDFSESTKVDESKVMSEEMFRSTVVDPILVSDWPKYKHQIVSDFEYPDILVSGEGIDDTAKMDMLASPVTMSLVDRLKSEKVIEGEPDEVISKSKGVKFDDFISAYTPEQMEEILSSDDCSFCRVKALNERLAELNLPILAGSDFSIFRTPKGFVYLSRLLFNRSMKASESSLDKLLSANVGLSEGMVSECTDCPEPSGEIVILLSKKPEERLEELECYGRKCTKPGDFEQVRSFCEKNSLIDFSVGDGIKALSKRSGNGTSRSILDMVLDNQPRKISTGDTAQDRGGSSAPLSQR